MNFEVRKKLMWKAAWQNTFMTVFAVFALAGPLFGLVTWIFDPKWTEWSVGVYVAVFGVLPIGLVFFYGVRDIVRMRPDDTCTVCDRNFVDCECSPETLENAGETTGTKMRGFDIEDEMARALESAASIRGNHQDSSVTDNSENVNRLASELVEIGSVPKIEGGQGSQPFFWRPEGEGVGPNMAWDPRAREIGEQLYRLGNGSLYEMRRAHAKVVADLGPMAGHALSAHWHNIGEQESLDDNGECWMH